MNSLLQRIKQAALESDPFPHAVVTEAIDEKLYSRLASEYPPIAAFTNDKEYVSHQRFLLYTSDVLSRADISPTWKEFVRFYASHDLFDAVVGRVDEHIRRMYPHLVRELGDVRKLRCGIYRIDTFATADVLLDVALNINAPVVGGTSRGEGHEVHLDGSDKLFSGLLYFRDPDDRSIGGDLMLHRYRKNKVRLYGKVPDPENVEPVKTVKYSSNVLVLFLNSVYALHSVSERSVAELPRRFLYFHARMKKPVFDWYNPENKRSVAIVNAAKERLSRFLGAQRS